MATAKSIIDGSLRKLGVLASGQSAKDTEYTDCMEVLKNLYLGMVNSGTFGMLRDVTIFDDYVAGNNEHIFRQTEYAGSIKLPELMSRTSALDYGMNIYSDPFRGNLPIDGTPPTDDGVRNEVIPPRDCAVVKVTDSVSDTTVTFIYDGHSKSWQGLHLMGLNFEAPLSDRDAEGLKAYLAVHLADEFGAEPSQLVFNMAKAYKRELAYRWASPGRTVPKTFF